MAKVTPEQMGMYLGRSALESVTLGDHALQRFLEAQGLPGVNDQFEYFTELAMFGMFPLDVIVVSHVPHVAERVRVAMRAHLLSGVNTMRGGARLAPLSQDDWERRVNERFARYTVALEIPNQTTGLPPYFAFAQEVSAALGARDNMAVHGHVAITFAMLMKHMPASVTALLED